MRTAFVIAACAVALGQTQTHNQLTPKEISEGWLLLYDGESAFGWSPEGGAQWATGPDGDLTVKTGDSGDLVHGAIFGDYQLVCDMKATSAKGSGLVLNGIALPTPKAGDRWHQYSVTKADNRLVASIDGKKVLDQATTQPGTIALHYRKGDSFSIKQLKLRPTGLRDLFNGRDLSGWRTVSAPHVKTPAVWTVVDGSIHVEHGPGELNTEAQFTNFVVQLEIRANSRNSRIHPDSGVFLRGDPAEPRSGYESQIQNEFEDDDAGKPVNFGTGGIYHQQPARKIVSSDNEFFTKTIVIRGRRIAVWVNGIEVTDWEDDSPEGPKVVPKKQAKVSAGVIGLEAHDAGTNVDFRSIRAAELR